MEEKDKLAYVVLEISVRVFVNLLLVFVLVEGFVAGYHFSYKLFTDLPYKPLATGQQQVAIEEGSNVFAVGTLLEQQGIVEDKYMFVARAYLGKYNDRIMAGSYTLGPSMSPDTICQILCGLQDGGTS